MQQCPPACPRVVEELIPAACHVTEQYANNVVEVDHGRLKARLRPMRGVKRLRSARVISARQAFIQNLRPRTRREYRPTASADSNLHRTRPRHLIKAARRNLVCFRLRNRPPAGWEAVSGHRRAPEGLRRCFPLRAT
jgi:hypothetical protein